MMFLAKGSLVRKLPVGNCVLLFRVNFFDTVIRDDNNLKSDENA